MDKPKLLSGHELVARGITKIDASLPEIGLKDVVPNGSWLEQKQIQSALEARKNLIGVERIEKSGVLSHAEWREDLMLAEVTRNVGGHWQYFGHNIGKKLYLKPEEALYLIEVNCLKLTHNEVKVSMQQAYTLLLRSKVSLLQYKVYASLSRIGYKVYRHEEKKLTEDETNSNKSQVNEIKNSEQNTSQMEIDNNEDKNTSQITNESENIAIKQILSNVDEITKGKEQKACETKDADEDASMNVDVAESTTEVNMSAIVADSNEKEGSDCKGNKTVNKNMNEDGARTEILGSDNVSSSEYRAIENNIIQNGVNDTQMDTDSTTSNVEKIHENVTTTNDVAMNCNDNESENVNTQTKSYHCLRLKVLENRQLQAVNKKNSEKYFEKVPDIIQKQSVTVTAPEEKYIPRNVFLNNISYLLNLDTIKSKTKTRSESTESRLYSCHEEVNGEHVKRIKAAASSNKPVTNQPPLLPNSRFSRPHFQNFWRPNMNFFPYNFMPQRPFSSHNFVPRFRAFNPRPSLLGMYPGFTSFQPNPPRSLHENKKRRNSVDLKNTHFHAIRGLALRLRHLVQSGNTQQQNIDALQRLINTFNMKYNMRLRINDNFEIFNDEKIIETITLDEDEEPRSKRSKKDDDEDKYRENFNKLKQLALKFKGLESQEEIISRHRRAFSGLIKKFNKAYNSDVYFNNDFQVIDRKFINLDSSSDSDCVIEEAGNSKGTKKLKNPFNILKRLSTKRVPATSCNNKGSENDNSYSPTLECFSKDWLPSKDDFGRAEVTPRYLMNGYLIQNKKDEYLFEFLKSQPYEYSNWLDIKLSFLKCYEEPNVMTENDVAETTPPSPLIQPDDNVDMPSVLKKLSIIDSNREVNPTSSLTIDFDVYNRDVQNFKKTNRPKPHFRVVCVSESSGFPSGKDVSSLHTKYGDVSIVFAVVGVGSISYLQINPIELPVYIPTIDLE